MPDRLENAFSDRETLLWLLTGLRVRSQDDLSRWPTGNQVRWTPLAGRWKAARAAFAL